MYQHTVLNMSKSPSDDPILVVEINNYKINTVLAIQTQSEIEI